MFAYRFTKAERKQYVAACKEILEQEGSFPRLQTYLTSALGRYLATQTLRNWFASPGAIPSDVAVVLADTYEVELGALCPWLSPKKG